MNFLYIDESGSINNRESNDKYFIIALVYVKDKESLRRSYKRFVSSNITRLQELDKVRKVHKTGGWFKTGGKMFKDGKFKELKGSQFDRDLKKKFIEHFMQKNNFEIFYIIISNEKLTDKFCENTARAFNFTMKLALEYFIKKGLLTDEDCFLQLDERNERTETRHFLENYLNTELVLNGVVGGSFQVQYFDSSNNIFVQIADVFANLLYSETKTSEYTDEINKLRESGFIKGIFEFPL